MAYKITIDGTDASSFINSSNEIPLNDRNRDYTMLIPQFTIQVSTSLSITPAVGDEVKFYEDSADTTPVFIGFISDFTEDVWTKEYDITVRHIIGLLDEYPVNYNTVHSLLTGGSAATEYNPNDDLNSVDYPTVNVLFLLKQIFTLTGYTLDISDLQTESANTLIETDTQEGVSKAIYIKHLVMDENMIYAINQDSAAFHTVFDKDSDYRLKMITLFQLFSELCSIITPSGSSWTGCYAVPSSASEFDLLHTTATTYAPSDSNVYFKDIKNIYPTQGGYYYELKMGASRRIFQDTTEDELIIFDVNKTVDGKNIIPVWNNFFVGYQVLVTTAELKMSIWADLSTPDPLAEFNDLPTVFIQDGSPGAETFTDIWFDSNNSYLMSVYFEDDDDPATFSWTTANTHFLRQSVALKHKISSIVDQFKITRWRVAADFSTLANVSSNKIDLDSIGYSNSQTSLIKQEVAI